eukprot:TRINITY_DN33260_c0_g1_i1.p1 TRINITY_DN33260_c0_g1~~TRINITY_DN33260_c0_g1_i1.p1  ORF type:complete len:319 (+),score=44.14 TRINITY_DN33260_c0_g1_i1:63-1019(+)
MPDDQGGGKQTAQLSDVLKRSHDLLSALKVQAMQRRSSTVLQGFETQGSVVSPGGGRTASTAEQMTSPINFTPEHSPIGAKPPRSFEEINLDDGYELASDKTYPADPSVCQTPHVIQEAERRVTNDWSRDLGGDAFGRSQQNFERTQQENDSYLAMKRAYIAYLADTALGKNPEIPNFVLVGESAHTTKRLYLESASRSGSGTASASTRGSRSGSGGAIPSKSANSCDSYTTSSQDEYVQPLEQNISLEIHNLNAVLKHRRGYGPKPKPSPNFPKEPSTYLALFQQWAVRHRHHKERELEDNMSRLNDQCYYPFPSSV